MAKNDRTEAAVALSPLLKSAAMEALRRYADLRPKWRDVYTGLVRLSQTGGGLVRYQPDHLIDLIVRSMEDELTARHRAAPERDGRVHLEDTLQYVLTRYWVLGTHDVVRIAARSHAGKVHTKLTSLYDRFRLVRVPLAKLKITGDDALKDGRVMLVHADENEAKSEAYRARSNDEYHPPTPIDERGSIGWHLFDVKTNAAGDDIPSPAFGRAARPVRLSTGPHYPSTPARLFLVLRRPESVPTRTKGNAGCTA